MAHQADSSVVETVIQLLCENGLSHMAEAMRIMLNESISKRSPISAVRAVKGTPMASSQRRSTPAWAR